MAYYNTWNPVYNFVMKIKKNYLDKFETIDYKQHHYLRLKDMGVDDYSSIFKEEG